MEKVLEELNLTPGIMGSYVFDFKKNVMAKKMPPVFKETKLISIAKLLLKIYTAGNMSLNDVSEVSLFYEESIVTIREIVDQIYIVVLFEPSASMNLLSMSLNLIIEDLKDLTRNYEKNKVTKIDPEPITTPELVLATEPIAAPEPVHSPEPIITPEPVHSPKPKQAVTNSKSFSEKQQDAPIIDSETLITSGPMAGVLQEMQIALAKVIGPIAKIIFMDALKEWIATDQPDFSTIQGLVDILRKEINEPEKFETYHKKITPYIWVDN